jgi:hypothetical protein
MRDLRDNQAIWTDGEAVNGTYCGVAYEGTIQDHDYLSRRTPDGRNFIFRVALTSPITVFGAERDWLEIWTNSQSNTIFA